MPYKSFKRGERWCVYKLDANDNPTGKTLGCHGSKSKADNQVSALYANEGSMDKSDIEKAKSLDEQSWDVYEKVFDMLNSTWWIVNIFQEYLILFYNGKYYQVNYSYGEDEEVVLAEQSLWTEVEQEWVAKTMNSIQDIGKIKVAVNKDADKEDADTNTPDTDVAEDELEFNIDVIEKSAKKQITYSVVYEPYVIDSQNDFADMEEIENMAHNYLKNHLISVRPAADLNHQEELELEDAIPVESYIAPADFEMGEQTIKKGSWVLAMHIPNPEIWAMVEKGEITGYSLRGRGLRIPAQIE